MKIIFITSSYLNQNNLGGTENLIINLTRLFKKENKIKIISPTNYLYKIQNKYLRKLFFDYINPFNIFVFYKILKTYKPDIVHFHNFYGISSVLAFISSRLGYKTVVTAHDHWIFCYWATMSKNGADCSDCLDKKKPFYKKHLLHEIHKLVNHFFLKQCYFTAPSKYMAKQLIEIGNFRNTKYIPNFVNDNIITSSYKKQIIWVGRIIKEKGLERFLPIINELIKKYQWEFVVIGDGPSKENLAANYPNIKFVGFINPKKYYKSASIILNTSILRENSPLSILEAMSYGIISLAPNIGGISDVIVNEHNGFLYDYKNLDQFKFKLKNLLSLDNDSIKKIGNKAIVIIKKKHSHKAVIKLYEKYYRELINSQQQ